MTARSIPVIATAVVHWTIFDYLFIHPVTWLKSYMEWLCLQFKLICITRFTGFDYFVATSTTSHSNTNITTLVLMCWGNYMLLNYGMGRDSDDLRAWFQQAPSMPVIWRLNAPTHHQPVTNNHTYFVSTSRLFCPKNDWVVPI